MNKTFWNLLLASPAMLGMSSIICAAALAQEAPTKPESSQVATAQASESTVAESIATPETLTLNTSASPAEEIAAVTPLEPQTQGQKESSTNAQTLGSDIKSIPDVATTTPLSTPTSLEISTAPQASDLQLNQPIQVAPATIAPAAFPEPIAQVPAAAPTSTMGGPILPAAPSAQPSAQASGSSNGMAQVTSVSQLSDVQPTDWAFQALQSLVERYGCIAGYPDGTFRGNRALTRYEFAAGLNACLDQITRLIGGATANFVTKEDLAVLQRLQEEFASELATLRGRVDALEARTTELEANQFSTTTKLRGEAIFAISDTYGDAAYQNDDNTNTNFGYRVRLNFNTSFTGQDLLTTRLQALNVAQYQQNGAANTNMARLAFDGGGTNNFTLDKLVYRFPAGRATVYLGPKGLALDDVASAVTPFNDSGNGALSRFAQRNPAVFRGPDGAGAGLRYAFSKGLRAEFGYLASDGDAPNPQEGRGIATGSYSAIAQLVFSLGSNFDLGLAYAHKYSRAGDVNVMGGTGSTLANRPFGQDPTSSDNFAAQFNWKPSTRFNLGGWFGYTRANQHRGGDGEATIMNAAITLAFPDLGRRGNLLGFVVGVPPKVTDSDGREDDETSLHIEGFYRFQVNDFISITPGVFVITNSDHNENNDTIFVGLLRTTFTF
ncbi:iron uptake porin [Kamptonema sp. UHCC 0994]|uniref:iron uptake porin n=1 Tax=Kamptonema sp. UHCC 0994 TaxID=3031329 RepID=UPI0023B9B35D|nr:iron uptake porin [Kamptonema sp. UHCC 0994]MDF0554410.1 iron uptake porin [Kamptonema sp. UHCC 0994]